jgi:molecular chaperone DnaK
VHSVKKSLTEYGDKIGADEKSNIEAAVAELEGALKSDDKDAIDAKAAALAQVSQKLGEKMYADAQGAADSAGGGAEAHAEQGSKQPDDNVVDAEFTEVTDGKK